MNRLRIGELAALCGVTRDTIRFYERAGLLGQPDRTEKRHRVYDNGTVDRVRFVRRLQGCGLTIEDIHRLVGLSQSEPSPAAQQLMRILRSRLESIESRITQLEACRHRLTDAMRHCAKARANGYAALAQLPPTESLPPVFAFGRRGAVLE